MRYNTELNCTYRLIPVDRGEKEEKDKDKDRIREKGGRKIEARVR